METKTGKRVLVTGAGGFIGSFIVEEALRRGYRVTAAVRASTSRKYLTDERIEFLELDFNDEDAFAEALFDATQKDGKWDYIVHNLGATKAANFDMFKRVNYEYPKLLVETLAKLDIVPECLLVMSSMSVLGIGDEKGGTPFTDKSIPNPSTKYGVSKFMCETFLKTQKSVPYIIFRPTGVYGPREKDYFLMIKTINSGFDFSVGYKEQRLTFIYVRDLARAVFDALEKGTRGKSYIISESKDYSQKDFRQIVKRELGKKFVIPVIAPIWLVRMVCFFSEKIAAMSLKTATLNRDKFKILKQRNWRCSPDAARDDFGFVAEYNLDKGLTEAIKWYKDNGWI